MALFVEASRMVLELMNAARAAFPLAAEAAAREIIESAGRFVEGEKPHDDQSILVLRRTGA